MSETKDVSWTSVDDLINDLSKLSDFAVIELNHDEFLKESEESVNGTFDSDSHRSSSLPVDDPKPRPGKAVIKIMNEIEASLRRANIVESEEIPPKISNFGKGRDEVPLSFKKLAKSDVGAADHPNVQESD